MLPSSLVAIYLVCCYDHCVMYDLPFVCGNKTYLTWLDLKSMEYLLNVKWLKRLRNLYKHLPVETKTVEFDALWFIHKKSRWGPILLLSVLKCVILIENETRNIIHIQEFRYSIRCFLSSANLSGVRDEKARFLECGLTYASRNINQCDGLW